MSLSFMLHDEILKALRGLQSEKKLYLVIRNSKGEYRATEVEHGGFTPVWRNPTHIPLSMKDLTQDQWVIHVLEVNHSYALLKGEWEIENAIKAEKANAGTV